jgi:hypothetical protein
MKNIDKEDDEEYWLRRLWLWRWLKLSIRKLKRILGRFFRIKLRKKR